MTDKINVQFKASICIGDWRTQMRSVTDFIKTYATGDVRRKQYI